MSDLIQDNRPPVKKQILGKIKPQKQGSSLRDYQNSLSSQSKQAVQKTVICADISGSMDGIKMDCLKNALIEVWRPGLYGLAFESEVWEFTDKEISMLDSMGNTSLLQCLEEAWAVDPKHIVLMSDGEPTDAPNDTIIWHVDKHKHIPIDCLGIGDGRISSYDPEFLKKIASITGGRYYEVGEPIKLTSVLVHAIEAPPNKLNQGGSSEGGSSGGGIIHL